MLYEISLGPDPTAVPFQAELTTPRLQLILCTMGFCELRGPPDVFTHSNTGSMKSPEYDAKTLPCDRL
jgi:hypothetical protein